MRSKYRIVIAFITAFIILGSSLAFYFLFFSGDENPLMSMRFSDKVLSENGSSEEGIDNSVESMNQFAVDLYLELAENSTENIFFSPLSIYIALSMAMEGARGETFTEMKEALNVVDDNETRRGSFASIQNDLNGRNGCELSLSNNFWFRDGEDIKPQYLSIIEDYYMAEIENASFASDPEGARKKINERIEQETKGRIKDIIPPGLLDPNTIVVLANAIYFKGQWDIRFDPEDTRDNTFFKNDESTVEIPMMNIDPTNREEDVKFESSLNETLDSLRLNYRNKDISMLFMLPGGWGAEMSNSDPIGISDLENMMDSSFIEDTNSGLSEQEIKVTIPKFSFETDYYLNDNLMGLGMEKAFNGNEADFSGIREPDPSNMFIDNVLHKTFISVDETGTEAAAATGVEIDKSMPTSFKADHPFIFLIQDNETGLILFMGRVMDPTM